MGWRTGFRGTWFGWEVNWTWTAWREEIELCVKGIEEGIGGGRCHYPFRSCIIEIIENDMNANIGSMPTETVDEVGRHFV